MTVGEFLEKNMMFGAGVLDMVSIWSNEACRGYCVEAMKNAGLDQATIEKVNRGLCWDLTELIDCAACGREVMFGHAFTSHEIQSKSGFGYGVCPECYEEERRRYYGEG